MFYSLSCMKRRKEEWWATVKIEPRGVLTIRDDVNVDAPFQGARDTIIPIQIATEDAPGQVDLLANVDVEGENIEDVEDVSHDEFHASGDDDSVDYDTETDGDSL